MRQVFGGRNETAHGSLHRRRGPVADRFLARFRASPRKIRVGIRPWSGGWVAVITERLTGRHVAACGRTAARALVRAYQAAEDQGLDGIDRWMGWAYDHPQGRLAPADRVARITEKESVAK